MSDSVREYFAAKRRAMNEDGSDVRGQWFLDETDIRPEIAAFIPEATAQIDAQEFGRCICEDCRPGQIVTRAWHLYWAACAEWERSG